MSREERRTIVFTSAVLLVASLVRFLWEARPVPPVLPPAEVPAELVEETREEIAREERMGVPLAEGETIDPNRAPDVELARLPGIGPAIAARIVESRENEGPYRRASDLMRVSGIGPATLERIAPVIKVSGSLSGTAPATPSNGRFRDADRETLVDLNRGTAEELQALPGLGPALSARIVHHRRQHGPFGRLEELTEVSGIGEATVRRIEPLVRLGR